VSSSINFWVGLDVHKDSITAAVFRDRDPEPLHVDRLPYDHRKIRRYVQRLQAQGTVRACYEASGAGYVLQRSLTEWGVECHLAAPSLIPRRPGERRKTDRRDAIKIARDFRDARLVLIHVPTEEDERVRDLVRCRETFQREIVKSRHYILKFMRRRGFVFREGENWTVRHFNWIRQVLTPGTLAEEDHIVLSEYLSLLEYKLQGLVPSEHSSGDRRRLGAITKAGNSRVRHTLIQAAWSYRRRPAVGAPLKRRQQGQDPEVIRHAWKCQHRLYSLFHRLAVKKPSQVAATAIARELVGFLWAVLRDIDVSQLQEVNAAA
jgi:transposase